MSEEYKDSGVIYWFSRNHVAANFLMLLIVVIGLGTWPSIKKEIFPEISIDAINVTVPYPNATPTEVEKGIIVPIEEAIQDVDGIDTIRSYANQGNATVTVEVATGYDSRNVMDDVKTRVDAIQNIAEEAEEPILEEILIKAQVMSVSVSADTDERTLRELAEQVRTGLLTYKGTDQPVTQAALAGVREYEISIEVSEQTLRQYGLTFDQVAGAVRRASLDLPGGSVKTEGGEVLLRTEQRRYSAEEFRDIIVITRPTARESSSVISPRSLMDLKKTPLRPASTEDPPSSSTSSASAMKTPSKSPTPSKNMSTKSRPTPCPKA